MIGASPAFLQGMFDLMCTPEGQVLNTAQMLVFQPPQAQAGSRANGSKSAVNGTDRDMTPLVVGMMHDTTAIQFRVVGARALGQLTAALQSHAGALYRMPCFHTYLRCASRPLLLCTRSRGPEADMPGLVCPAGSMHAEIQRRLCTNSAHDRIVASLSASACAAGRRNLGHPAELPAAIVERVMRLLQQAKFTCPRPRHANSNHTQSQFLLM